MSEHVPAQAADEVSRLEAMVGEAHRREAQLVALAAEALGVAPSAVRSTVDSRLRGQALASSSLDALQELLAGASVEVIGVRPWLDHLLLAATSEDEDDAKAAALEAAALEAALRRDLVPLVEEADRVRRRMLGQEAALKAEEALLAARRKAIRRRLDLLDERMLAIVSKAGKPVEAPSVRVAVHKCPAALVIEEWVDPALLEPRFQRVTVEPNKAAIKAAIKAGEAVRGCELAQGERIDWK